MRRSPPGLASVAAQRSGVQARPVPRAGARAPERLTVAEALRAARSASYYYGMEAIRGAVSARRIDRCPAEDDTQLSTAEAAWLLCRSRQYVRGLIHSGALPATRADFRDSWRWVVRFGDVREIA